VVGSTHIWIFQNPLEKGIEKKHYPPITYEYAQEEIASKAGINIHRLVKVTQTNKTNKQTKTNKHVFLKNL
jgi:hypothetical protein